MSFRALSPASESRVPHAETLALPTVVLRKVCPKAPVSRVRRSTRRTGSAYRSERSFSGPLPGSLGGSVRGFRGQKRCTLRKPSMACQHLGPGRPCPLNSGVPGVVQLQQTRTGRPTRSLKRTAEAFSGDSGLWSLSLRGAARAFMGRSLSSYTLAGLNFFCCFLNGKVVP